jgi:hypothetical protein
MPGSSLTQYGDYHHQATMLGLFGKKLGSDLLLGTLPLIPSTPTISTVTTTDDNWTIIATGLTNILEWKLMELNGNDFHYAFEAVPGNDFSIGYSWVSQKTSPATLYVKNATAGQNITIKFERWTI